VFPFRSGGATAAEASVGAAVFFEKVGEVLVLHQPAIGEEHRRQGEDEMNWGAITTPQLSADERVRDAACPIRSQETDRGQLMGDKGRYHW
jgi:hypothetical protein